AQRSTIFVGNTLSPILSFSKNSLKRDASSNNVFSKLPLRWFMERPEHIRSIGSRTRRTTLTLGKRRANCATVSSLNPAYGGEMSPDNESPLYRNRAAY